jgi:hypothetical protein
MSKNAVLLSIIHNRQNRSESKLMAVLLFIFCGLQFSQETIISKCSFALFLYKMVAFSARLGYIFAFAQCTFKTHTPRSVFLWEILPSFRYPDSDLFETSNGLLPVAVSLRQYSTQIHEYIYIYIYTFIYYIYSYMNLYVQTVVNT